MFERQGEITIRNETRQQYKIDVVRLVRVGSSANAEDIPDQLLRDSNTKSLDCYVKVKIAVENPPTQI